MQRMIQTLRMVAVQTYITNKHALWMITPATHFTKGFNLIFIFILLAWWLYKDYARVCPFQRASDMDGNK
jgi:hypothetical protein